jgi:probable F420-dependent oxidoreductase
VRFSVTVFLTDQTIGAVEMARECEARGFHGLYLPEHTHIPTSRATPAPMGEPLPGYYSRCVDPFVALAAAAAATTTLRLGTGICLVAQREPIVTAKQVATLDMVSGGRFTFGVGFGWNVEEAADHGVERSTRRDRVREHILAMRELWTQDEASFDGEYVQFQPSWQWPKPAQQPHPPVWLGVGAGPQNFAHLAEYADGWIPIGGRGLAEAIPELQRAFKEAGRDVSKIDIVPFGSTPDRGKFDHFAALGVTEVVANAPSGLASDVLPFLDRYAEIAEEFVGS